MKRCNRKFKSQDVISSWLFCCLKQIDNELKFESAVNTEYALVNNM